MDFEGFLASGDVSIESGEAMIHHLKGLVDSEGWRIYRSIVERQQVVRFDSIVLSPLKSHDEVLEQEYQKGEIQGMRVAVNLPLVLIEDINDQLARLRQQREQQEGEPE